MSDRHIGSYAVPTEVASQFRRLTPTGRHAEIAALTSKLVPELATQRFGQNFVIGGHRNRPLISPDMGLLQRISDITANDVSDAQTIFQLLPETELAMQILVSSILAPKDLVTSNVSITLGPNRFSSELGSQMLAVVTDHFEKIYKISDLLKPSLDDALFLTGSYPLLILPESSIDRAINNPGRVSFESVRDDIDAQGNVRNLGFLGNAHNDKTGPVINFGLEDINGARTYNPKVTELCVDLESKLEIVDNPNLLKVNALQKRVTADKTYHLLGRRKMTGLVSTELKVSQEAYTAATQMGLGTPYGTATQYQPVQLISPAHDIRRASIGHPLVMKLPSEAVIPVHQPSNPSKHLGYFIMVDAMGNPVSSARQRDFYADMANSLNPNSSMGSQLMAQAKRNIEGQATDRQHEIDEMARIYGQFLEKELTDRLRNGIYGDQVEVTAPQEVYRVMLARSFQNKQTRLLYVPAEMLTYIAFDYNNYGVGQSLLQNSKILGGLRVLSLFAETMASIKNSINRTRLGITLDPDDPNPTQTVEFLMGEYVKTRQGSFPLGATNPTDIVSYLQNASTDVEVQGNTRYPETKLEITERQSQRVKPDDTMSKDLRDRHLMAMGLSPDMVDAGANAEFATSVLANNLLLAKRVLTYQQVFEGFLEEFIKKYILADGDLMDQLRQLVQEYHGQLTKDQKKAEVLAKDAKTQRALLEGKRVSRESIDEQLESLENMNQDAVVMEFLQALEIALPKPDMATIKSQMDAYDTQEQAYEKALDAYINDAYLESKGLGSLSELVAPVKAAAKAELLRRWLRENDVLPELDELLTGDKDESRDLAKDVSDHMDSMGDSLLKIMYRFAQQRQLNDPAVVKLQKILEESGTDFGGGSSSDSFSAPDNSGGGDFGSGEDGGFPEMPEIGGGETEDSGETTETDTTDTDSSETKTEEDKDKSLEPGQPPSFDDSGSL